MAYRICYRPPLQEGTEVPRFITANKMQMSRSVQETTPMHEFQGGTKLTFITCWGRAVKPFREVE